MELYHFFVVLRRHASLGRHIDDHNTLFVLDKVTQTLDLISIYVSGTDFPER